MWWTKIEPASVGTTTCHNRPAAVSGLTPAVDDTRMALILMFIVVTYMITNTPRMILNAYEFTINDFWQANRQNDCYMHPR